MSNTATVIVGKNWHPTEIRMPHGGPKTVFTAALPDWTLLYVEYIGQDELDLIRKALYKAEMKIVRVTRERDVIVGRVYFEEAA